MAEQRWTLMAVLAHPDDEVWMSATMAKYAGEGVRTVLVTATLGEEGEIRDPDLDPAEVRARLGAIREAELRRSAAIIGIDQLYILGYRDSGMAGTPANDDPHNFHNAAAHDVLGRLVHIIREEQPQVIVTDNERGTYGHPDHMAANRATVAAFQAAGDPLQFPQSGPEPWRPAKLYYTAFARSDFIAMRKVMREHGVDWGSEEENDEMLDFTVPDDQVTTRIDVGPYRSLMRQAMAVHRTQIAPDDPWLTLPEELAATMHISDSYTRVQSLVDAPLPENDLFAGLRVPGDSQPEPARSA